MNRDQLLELLASVQRGETDVDAAARRLSDLPFIDTEVARVDTHRALRHGIPEVVYGLHKTSVQIAEVVSVLRGAEQDVLVTRVEPEVAAQVLGREPGGAYDDVAQLLYYRAGGGPIRIQGKGMVAVVCAGTADLPVALEAAKVAEYFGNEVELLKDVGVAGLHRLLASHDVLRRARILIVVAGMEGALPSVVGGMVDKPVIGVPTSVGYGAAMGGLTALFGMLTSCSSNVTVVNIDNGFGAAYAATLINRL